MLPDSRCESNGVVQLLHRWARGRLDGAAVPVAARFVVWAEFCERFSYYGMRAVLALFLVELGFSEAGATVGVHLFIAGAYAAPLLGAALSDAVCGRFATILFLSVVNLVGSAALGAGGLVGSAAQGAGGLGGSAEQI